jgi:hypothetical protein
VDDMRGKLKASLIALALLAVTGAGVATAATNTAATAATPMSQTEGTLCQIVPPLPPGVDPCDMHW